MTKFIAALAVIAAVSAPAFANEAPAASASSSKSTSVEQKLDANGKPVSVKTETKAEQKNEGSAAQATPAAPAAPNAPAAR